MNLSIPNQMYFRNLLYRSFIPTVLLIILSVASTQAQVSIDRVLASGKEDASKLTRYYVTPIAKGFSSGLNNGWYFTAEPHESLGFNISITASASMVPEKDEFFTFMNSKYSNLRLTDTDLTQVDAPTIMGPATEGENVTVYNDDFGTDVAIENFNLPQGIGLKDEIGFNAVPTPMVSLGIGVVANTDVVVRFVPELKSDDGSFGMWGVGIKHDIKQWLPVVKALPFQLSFFGGYTKLNGSLNMEGIYRGRDQEAILDVEAITLQLLAGKNIGVLNVYAGIGYDKATTDAKILGEYILEYSDITDVTVTLYDPVDIAIESTHIRATAGFGLKLGPVALNADYSIAEYHTATVGFNITVR